MHYVRKIVLPVDGLCDARVEVDQEITKQWHLFLIVGTSALVTDETRHLAYDLVDFLHASLSLRLMP